MGTGKTEARNKKPKSDSLVFEFCFLFSVSLCLSGEEEVFHNRDTEAPGRKKSYEAKAPSF